MIKKHILTLVLVIFSFFIGFWAAQRKNIDEQLDINFGQRQEGYEFISPLLDCEPNISSSNYKLLKIKQEIDNLITDKKNSQDINHVSVYFRDLNNGPWFGIEEKANYSPASLLKVPVMIGYLKIAEKNPNILKEKIPLSEDDQEDSDTIINLIYKMIAESDNEAFRALTLSIDYKDIEDIHKELSIIIPSEQTEEDYIDVKSYASLFRVLFNSSYLSREMSQLALEILNKTSFSDGLKKGVPSNIDIAHKFGFRDSGQGKEKQLHDFGIIYYPENPYLLCVMTRGNDEKKLADHLFLFRSIQREQC